MARPTSRDDELRRVYRTHVHAVYAFLAYAVSREVAEDLTSVTFERVIKAWNRFDPSVASERTWVIAIARNALTDHFRRQQHRSTVSTDEHPALLDSVVATDDPLGKQLTREGLITWLNQLNERERQVVAMRFGADMAASAVAVALSISEGNVHQITSRALRRLRSAADSEGVNDNVAPSVLRDDSS